MVSHEFIIEIMDGGRDATLSIVRPCGMDVLPSGALDMSGSLNLTIDYLLKGEWED